jgi:catechol 2,3-dioxygenase-like lactoylglutathione lyase family enzyme
MDMEDWFMASSVHISLNVSDLDRSVDFYRSFFGEPRKLKPGYAKFVTAEPEIHLALQPGRRPGDGEGALSHFGIRVGSTEDVRRWERDLAARGLATGKVEREECCYAVQDKFWLSDPDGNRWEVYTVLEDVETPRSGATACCAR